MTWPQSAPLAHTEWFLGPSTHYASHRDRNMGPQRFYGAPSTASHYQGTHTQVLYPDQAHHLPHPDPHFQHNLMYQRRLSVPELRNDPTGTHGIERISLDQTQERQDRFGSEDH